MRHFDDIFDIAADRKGGAQALNAMLSKPLSAADLAAIPEDRWLATMSKCIFQAGFNWKVVENKWDGFETAFHGFDVARNAFMDDDTFDAHLTNTAIIRNGAKIAAIRDNAAFLLELRAEGGAGKVLGGWPVTDFVGLLEMLKKHGYRLGGMSGQYAMRYIGRDGFILSRDVSARLIAEGIVAGPTTSKTARRAVQAAFNIWAKQSGRSLSEISQVLGMSL